MLPRILARVPNSCIVLSRPLPIYTSVGQWKLVKGNLVYAPMIHYYRKDVSFIYSILTNPVNSAHIEDMLDKCMLHILEEVAAKYTLPYNVACAVFKRIVNRFMTVDKVDGIKRLITSHPALREELVKSIEGGEIKGLYHLVPEVSIPKVMDPWLICDDEFIYLYNLDALDISRIGISQVTSMSLDVIKCIMSDNPITALDYYMHYRVHGVSALCNIPLDIDKTELIDYLLLLGGKEPGSKSYTDCAILADVIGNNDMYNEECILHILRNTTDTSDALNIYDNIDSYDTDRVGIHRLIALSVLHDIVSGQDVKFIKLDDCHICKRLKEKYD